MEKLKVKELLYVVTVSCFTPLYLSWHMVCILFLWTVWRLIWLNTFLPVNIFFIVFNLLKSLFGIPERPIVFIRQRVIYILILIHWNRKVRMYSLGIKKVQGVHWYMGKIPGMKRKCGYATEIHSHLWGMERMRISTSFMWTIWRLRVCMR